MTSEVEIESRPAAAAACFPEPAIDDQTIRRDEDMLAFLGRSKLDHAVELRRFTNANLKLLLPDVARAMCEALHHLITAVALPDNGPICECLPHLAQR